MQAMQRSAPHWVRSEKLDDLIMPAMSHTWRTASEIAKAIRKPEEEVRYRLVKLTNQGRTHRQRKPGTGRVIYFYRLAR